MPAGSMISAPSTSRFLICRAAVASSLTARGSSGLPGRAASCFADCSATGATGADTAIGISLGFGWWKAPT